jgi:hypothetical protein
MTLHGHEMMGSVITYVGQESCRGSEADPVTATDSPHPLQTLILHFFHKAACEKKKEQRETHHEKKSSTRSVPGKAPQAHTTVIVNDNHIDFICCEAKTDQQHKNVSATQEEITASKTLAGYANVRRTHAHVFLPRAPFHMKQRQNK